jgi:hypothetical protein
MRYLLVLPLLFSVAFAGTVVDTLRPFADNTSYAQWTQNIGSTEYEAIDDAVLDVEATFIASSVNLAQSKHWYTDASYSMRGTDTTLDSVIVVGFAMEGATGFQAGNSNFRFSFDLQNDGHATVYGDYEVITGTGYTDGEWFKWSVPDPASGSWSDYSGDDLDSLTAGVQKGDDTSPQCDISWMAVLLYYTVPTYSTPRIIRIEEY